MTEINDPIENHSIESKKDPKMAEWQPIETAPEDTAVLTYGFGYEVAHYNTQIKAWVGLLGPSPDNANSLDVTTGTTVEKSLRAFHPLAGFVPPESLIL